MVSSFWSLIDHTRHITIVGLFWTSDQLVADLYLTTQNIHNRQTAMSSVGFFPILHSSIPHTLHQSPVLYRFIPYNSCLPQSSHVKLFSSHIFTGVPSHIHFNLQLYFALFHLKSSHVQHFSSHLRFLSYIRGM